MRENRFENILAYMAAAVIGISILSIIAIVLASFFKIKLIAVVIALPLVGLPIGFILVFALLITALIRKSKSNR